MVGYMTQKLLRRIFSPHLRSTLKNFLRISPLESHLSSLQIFFAHRVNTVSFQWHFLNENGTRHVVDGLSGKNCRIYFWNRIHNSGTCKIYSWFCTGHKMESIEERKGWEKCHPCLEVYRKFCVRKTIRRNWKAVKEKSTKKNFLFWIKDQNGIFRDSMYHHILSVRINIFLWIKLLKREKTLFRCLSEKKRTRRQVLWEWWNFDEKILQELYFSLLFPMEKCSFIHFCQCIADIFPSFLVLPRREISQ